MGKNNQKELINKMKPTKQRWGLRKLSIGVASVLLGLSFMGASAAADSTDVPANGSTPVAAGSAATGTGQSSDQPSDQSAANSQASEQPATSSQVGTQAAASTTPAASQQPASDNGQTQTFQIGNAQPAVDPAMLGESKAEDTPSYVNDLAGFTNALVDPNVSHIVLTNNIDFNGSQTSLVSGGTWGANFLKAYELAANVVAGSRFKNIARKVVIDGQGQYSLNMGKWFISLWSRNYGDHVWDITFKDLTINQTNTSYSPIYFGNTDGSLRAKTSLTFDGVQANIGRTLNTYDSSEVMIHFKGNNTIKVENMARGTAENRINAVNGSTIDFSDGTTSFDINGDNAGAGNSSNWGNSAVYSYSTDPDKAVTINKGATVNITSHSQDFRGISVDVTTNQQGGVKVAGNLNIDLTKAALDDNGNVRYAGHGTAIWAGSLHIDGGKVNIKTMQDNQADGYENAWVNGVTNYNGYHYGVVSLGSDQKFDANLGQGNHTLDIKNAGELNITRGEVEGKDGTIKKPAVETIAPLITFGNGGGGNGVVNTFYVDDGCVLNLQDSAQTPQNFHGYPWDSVGAYLGSKNDIFWPGMIHMYGESATDQLHFGKVKYVNLQRTGKQRGVLIALEGGHDTGSIANGTNQTEITGEVPLAQWMGNNVYDTPDMAWLISHLFSQNEAGNYNANFTPKGQLPDIPSTSDRSLQFGDSNGTVMMMPIQAGKDSGVYTNGVISGPKDDKGVQGEWLPYLQHLLDNFNWWTPRRISFGTDLFDPNKHVVTKADMYEPEVKTIESTTQHTLDNYTVKDGIKDFLDKDLNKIPVKDANMVDWGKSHFGIDWAQTKWGQAYAKNKQELKAARDAYNNATTDAARDAAQKAIDTATANSKLTSWINTYKGKKVSDDDIKTLVNNVTYSDQDKQNYDRQELRQQLEAYNAWVDRNVWSVKTSDGKLAAAAAFDADGKLNNGNSATIYYTDGSCDFVVIPFNVITRTMAQDTVVQGYSKVAVEGANEAFSSVTTQGQIPQPADLIANSQNLPAGTTYEWEGGSVYVASQTPGTFSEVVKVTLPNGTVYHVPVTIQVLPRTSSTDAGLPQSQTVQIEQNGDLTNLADEGIANKGKLSKAVASYSWENGTPSTATLGTTLQHVVINYTDGTSQTIPVYVNVHQKVSDRSVVPLSGALVMQQVVISEVSNNMYNATKSKDNALRDKLDPTDFINDYAGIKDKVSRVEFDDATTNLLKQKYHDNYVDDLTIVKVNNGQHVFDMGVVITFKDGSQKTVKGRFTLLEPANLENVYTVQGRVPELKQSWLLNKGTEDWQPQSIANSYTFTPDVNKTGANSNTYYSVAVKYKNLAGALNDDGTVQNPVSGISTQIFIGTVYVVNPQAVSHYVWENGTNNYKPMPDGTIQGISLSGSTLSLDQPQSWGDYLNVRGNTQYYMKFPDRTVYKATWDKTPDTTKPGVYTLSQTFTFPTTDTHYSPFLDSGDYYPVDVSNLPQDGVTVTSKLYVLATPQGGTITINSGDSVAVKDLIKKYHLTDGDFIKNLDKGVYAPKSIDDNEAWVTAPSSLQNSTGTMRVYYIDPTNPNGPMLEHNGDVKFIVIHDTDTFQPAWKDTQVYQGQTATVDPTWVDDKQPTGTVTYQLKAGTPDWITINSSTGEITYKPTTATEVDVYTVPVDVTYADSSTETVNARVAVLKPTDYVHFGQDTSIIFSAPAFDYHKTSSGSGQTIKPADCAFNEIEFRNADNKHKRSIWKLENGQYVNTMWEDGAADSSKDFAASDIEYTGWQTGLAGVTKPSTDVSAFGGDTGDTLYQLADGTYNPAERTSAGENLPGNSKWRILFNIKSGSKAASLLGSSSAGWSNVFFNFYGAKDQYTIRVNKEGQLVISYTDPKTGQTKDMTLTNPKGYKAYAGDTDAPDDLNAFLTKYINDSSLKDHHYKYTMSWADPDQVMQEVQNAAAGSTINDQAVRITFTDSDNPTVTSYLDVIVPIKVVDVSDQAGGIVEWHQVTYDINEHPDWHKIDPNSNFSTDGTIFNAFDLINGLHYRKFKTIGSDPNKNVTLLDDRVYTRQKDTDGQYKLIYTDTHGNKYTLDASQFDLVWNNTSLPENPAANTPRVHIFTRDSANQNILADTDTTLSNQLPVGGQDMLWINPKNEDMVGSTWQATITPNFYGATANNQTMTVDKKGHLVTTDDAGKPDYTTYDVTAGNAKAVNDFLSQYIKQTGKNSLETYVAGQPYQSVAESGKPAYTFSWADPDQVKRDAQTTGIHTEYVKITFNDGNGKTSQLTVPIKMNVQFSTADHYDFSQGKSIWIMQGDQQLGRFQQKLNGDKQFTDRNLAYAMRLGQVNYWTNKDTNKPEKLQNATYTWNGDFTAAEAGQVGWHTLGDKAVNVTFADGSTATFRLDVLVIARPTFLPMEVPVGYVLGNNTGQFVVANFGQGVGYVKALNWTSRPDTSVAGQVIAKAALKYDKGKDSHPPFGHFAENRLDHYVVTINTIAVVDGKDFTPVVVPGFKTTVIAQQDGNGKVMALKLVDNASGAVRDDFTLNRKGQLTNAAGQQLFSPTTNTLKIKAGETAPSSAELKKAVNTSLLDRFGLNYQLLPGSLRLNQQTGQASGKVDLKLGSLNFALPLMTSFIQLPAAPASSVQSTTPTSEVSSNASSASAAPAASATPASSGQSATAPASEVSSEASSSSAKPTSSATTEPVPSATSGSTATTSSSTETPSAEPATSTAPSSSAQSTTPTSEVSSEASSSVAEPSSSTSTEPVASAASASSAQSATIPASEVSSEASSSPAKPSSSAISEPVTSAAPASSAQNATTPASEVSSETSSSPAKPSSSAVSEPVASATPASSNQGTLSASAELSEASSSSAEPSSSASTVPTSSATPASSDQGTTTPASEVSSEASSSSAEPTSSATTAPAASAAPASSGQSATTPTSEVSSDVSSAPVEPSSSTISEPVASTAPSSSAAEPSSSATAAPAASATPASSSQGATTPSSEEPIASSTVEPSSSATAAPTASATPVSSAQSTTSAEVSSNISSAPTVSTSSASTAPAASATPASSSQGATTPSSEEPIASSAAEPSRSATSEPVASAAPASSGQSATTPTSKVSSDASSAAAEPLSSATSEPVASVAPSSSAQSTTTPASEVTSEVSSSSAKPTSSASTEPAQSATTSTSEVSSTSAEPSSSVTSEPVASAAPASSVQGTTTPTSEVSSDASSATTAASSSSTTEPIASATPASSSQGTTTPSSEEPIASSTAAPTSSSTTEPTASAAPASSAQSATTPASEVSSTPASEATSEVSSTSAEPTSSSTTEPVASAALASSAQGTTTPASEVSSDISSATVAASSSSTTAPVASSAQGTTTPAASEVSSDISSTSAEPLSSVTAVPAPHATLVGSAHATGSWVDVKTATVGSGTPNMANTATFATGEAKASAASTPTSSAHSLALDEAKTGVKQSKATINGASDSASSAAKSVRQAANLPRKDNHTSGLLALGLSGILAAFGLAKLRHREK